MFAISIVFSILLVEPVLCFVTLTGGQLAGIIIGCILVTIVLTLAVCLLLWILCRKSVKAEQKKNASVYKTDVSENTKQYRPSNTTSNNERMPNVAKIRNKDVIRIPIKHKNLANMGFDLYGNHREGVFLKDLDKSRFKENVKLNNGDKLIGLEFDVKNLSFIDIFALLNRVLPFTNSLTLVVQKKYGKTDDNRLSTNVVALRSSETMVDENKTKRSHSIIGAADTIIKRSYGSYRQRFSAKERPRKIIAEEVNEERREHDRRETHGIPESNIILPSKSPKITTRRGSNFDTKVTIDDDESEPKDGLSSTDRFEDLSVVDKIDLVRLSYESSNKTQSTPNLVNNALRTNGRKLNGSTDSESLDLNPKEPDPLSPPIFEQHQTLTKAASDISRLKEDDPTREDPNNNVLPRTRPASYFEQEKMPPEAEHSTKFVPISRSFMPNYDSLRTLEDKYNIDVDDYEKLLYFEHLLAIQNEHLKTMGISVPEAKATK